MSAEPIIGQVLNKKYQVVRLLGQGGMGAVYEAVHCELDLPVAIKTLVSGLANDSTAYERFLREARAASRLRHPHIIEVTDFDHTAGGMPYMVMQLLEGQDMSRRLSSGRRLTPAEAKPIFRDVLSAVQAAHQAGIVHRDLKPQNIFLCRYGDRTDFPKLLDFGISKVLDASALTGSHAYMGTPNYMAPEQATGHAGDADDRTDIFALGAILYRALGGKDAFMGQRPATVLYKVVNEEPSDLAALNPALPAGLVEIVNRAMAKDPADRFASAAELSGALLPAMEEPAIHHSVASTVLRADADTPAPQPPAPTPALVRGWSPPWRIYGAAVGILVVGLMVVAWLAGGAPPHHDPPPDTAALAQDAGALDSGAPDMDRRAADLSASGDVRPDSRRTKRSRKTKKRIIKPRQHKGSRPAGSTEEDEPVSKEKEVGWEE